MKVAQESRVEPEHLVVASLVLLHLSWFIIVALLDGNIRMGTGSLASVNLSRQEDPSNYWFSVGWLFFFTIMGWIAVGLNAYRLFRGRVGSTLKK